MQEVFEKIIERLETERLKREEQLRTCHDSDAEDYLRCKMSGLADAIEIVKQEAEKFGTDTNVGSNGWIPCSERLPEEPEENPLFEYKTLELYLVTTKYGSSEQDKKYPFRAFWNGINFTDGMNILDVVAWMPLPQPYQPKGE